jgi:hypothetical protein
MLKVSPSSRFFRFPIFTTRTLWHHLWNPPAHPLSQRTLASSATHYLRPAMVWVVPLVVVLTGCGFWMVPTESGASVVLFVLSMAVSASTGYVVVWVITVCNAISTERDRGTYDLLCLPPSGALRANWAICTAFLHSHGGLGWISLIRKLCSGLLLLALLSALMITASLSRTASPFQPQFAGLFLDMIALAFVSYIDHIQSVVLGSLIGMLAPQFNWSRMTARIWAPWLFVSAQVIPLLVTAFALLLMPESSPMVLGLFVFWLMRESLIFVLWRTLIFSLNADPKELIGD